MWSVSRLMKMTLFNYPSFSYNSSNSRYFSVISNLRITKAMPVGNYLFKNHSMAFTICIVRLLTTTSRVSPRHISQRFPQFNFEAALTEFLPYYYLKDNFFLFLESVFLSTFENVYPHFAAVELADEKLVYDSFIFVIMHFRLLPRNGTAYYSLVINCEPKVHKSIKYLIP